METLSSLRRLLPLIAACGLAVAAAPAYAQLLEFTGTELRARIDQPSVDNVWTVGDANGNGAVDEDETFGTRIDIDDAFLNAPGYAYVGPESSRQGFSASSSQTQFELQIPDLFLDNRNFGGVVYAGNEAQILGIAIDYADFYYLPSYEAVSATTFAEFRGAQLMQVLSFEGDPALTLSRTNETLEVGFGARFFTSLQRHQFQRSNWLLGHTAFAAYLENQALGPQVSLRWTLRRGPWQARAEAAAAITYMNLDGDSSGQMGETLLPGGFNQPAILAPNTFDHHVNEWDLSPTVEAGLLGSYDVTSASRAFIRCDAIQFGNVRSVEDAIVWRLPNLGLRDPGGSDVTITSASIGLEMRR